jgi:hypothetical protein
MKPWVQTPVLPKKERKKRRRNGYILSEKTRNVL